MKAFRLSFLVLLTAGLMTTLSASAAPIESVESARASVALQKLDAFLGEQIVAERLAALGLSQEQVSARLAQLSDTQLEELAAQVDLLQAGGTVQSGTDPLGHTLHCIFDPLGRLLYNVYQLIFCWGDLK